MGTSAIYDGLRWAVAAVAAFCLVFVLGSGVGSLLAHWEPTRPYVKLADAWLQLNVFRRAERAQIEGLLSLAHGDTVRAGLQMLADTAGTGLPQLALAYR